MVGKLKAGNSYGFWADETRVDMLKKLWAEGMSCSQVAERLGGITRNAVIGKVHRLGLSGRATTSRKKTRHGLSLRPKKPRPTYQIGAEFRAKHTPLDSSPLPPPSETDIPRILFAEALDTQCKWITSLSGPAMCCGDVSIPSKPYCAHHTRRAAPPLVQPKSRYTPGRKELIYAAS